MKSTTMAHLGVEPLEDRITPGVLDNLPPPTPNDPLDDKVGPGLGTAFTSNSGTENDPGEDPN